MKAGLNPLKLTETDGYRILGTGDPNRPAPKAVENQPGYVELRDLLGGSHGRIQDWKLLEHIEMAKERNWPTLKANEFHGQEIALCGGGASLGDPEVLRALRKLYNRGIKVFAVNRTHDWLITKGIVPWGAALLDPIPHVKNYITPRKGIKYFIASQCHPDTLDVFDKPGVDKTIWHARASGAEAAVLTESELNGAVASKTSTVGLRSSMLTYKMGFRRFHFFGFDSSYPTFWNEYNDIEPLLKDDKPSLHAYDKPETVHDMRKVRCVMPDGSILGDFFTTSAMAAQADEFQMLLKDISIGIQLGAMEQVFFHVYGVGLLPSIAAFYQLHAKKEFNERKGVNKCPLTVIQQNQRTLTIEAISSPPPPVLETSSLSG